jgi:DAACS family dicarboxylate/amino acid:cation (Na+ or H+) symporter
MAWLFASQGTAAILALGKLIGTMYLGLLLMVVCCWLILMLLGERPLSVTRQVIEPVVLGFTTRSSEVTLPVHMDVLERMGVPNRVVALILPLGYSFNLDGSTLYVTLAVTFLAEAYHVELSWSAELTILITAMIASKGIANVPSGVKLTRFRGHRTVWVQGVHDGQDKIALRTRVPPPDGGIGACWPYAGGTGCGV